MKTPNPIFPTAILVTVLAGYSLTARSASLDDTAEVRCVTKEGEIKTDCAQSGQDAATGRDVTTPGNKNGLAGFKFQKVCKNGNIAGRGDCPADPLLGDTPKSWACTKDQVTGILWEMKTDSGNRNYRIWYDFSADDDENPPVDQHVSEINAVALCGKTDWRLPNNQEAQSIVAYGQGDGINLPTIDTAYFPYSQATGMWTGTRAKRAENFILNLQTGSLSLWDASIARPVRLISYQTKYLVERFQIRSSNEVYDAGTKLIWRRCAEGKVPNQQNCGSTPATTFTFFEAIAHVKEVAAATGLPWRVPNIKELVSITNAPKENPASKTKIFPGFDSVSAYFSSTPFIESGKSTGKAWAMDPLEGGVGTGASDGAVLLVRNGDTQ